MHSFTNQRAGGQRWYSVLPSGRGSSPFRGHRRVHVVLPCPSSFGASPVSLEASLEQETSGVAAPLPPRPLMLPAVLTRTRLRQGAHNGLSLHKAGKWEKPVISDAAIPIPKMIKNFRSGVLNLWRSVMCKLYLVIGSQGEEGTTTPAI